MLNTGHRGASGTEPENTLRAFHAALAMGAEALELDVHRCKSGEMVVIHDDDVSRTTNGQGKVSELTLDELRRFDAGKGEQIPTLEEVLHSLRGCCRDGKNPTVFIEIKSPGEQQVADTVHHAVATQGWSYAELPVIGFDHPQIGRVKQANPQIETGISLDKGEDAQLAGLLPLAKSLGASAVNPHHSMVTPEWVADAHANGLKVNTWTVNEHADIKRVIEAGVDSVIGNYPDRTRLLAQALTQPDKTSAQQR